MKNLFLAFLIFALMSILFINGFENDVIVYYGICSGLSWLITAVFYAATLRQINLENLYTNIFAIEHLIENRDIAKIEIFYEQFFNLFDKEFCCSVQDRYPFYDDFELFNLLKRYIYVNYKN